MAGIYPSLQEKFRVENVCPICMVEMGNSAKYVCSNNHTLCNQCKQFYYNCPTCKTPLSLEVSHVSVPMSMPMPTTQTFEMPQPTYSMHQRTFNVPQSSSFNIHPYPPSAPTHEEFFEQERNHSYPELFSCPYSLNGCWAKFPKALEELHVSRCQFRPHLEEETQPTDLGCNNDDLIECRYKIYGCCVKIPPWRKNVHEERCNYKENLEENLKSLNLSSYGDEEPVYTNDDENTVVECSFKEHGCKVRVPLRSLIKHEEKCPYNRDGVAVYASDDEESDVYKNGLVLCKYKKNGCIAIIPHDRKTFHESRCMYRDKTDYNDYCCDNKTGNEQPVYTNDDENTVVECEFKKYGCKVRVPIRSLMKHEEKCPYNRDGVAVYASDDEEDTECYERGLVQCRYKRKGCIAVVPIDKKEFHEERCMYRK